MSQSRVDIYAEIHKGLRRELCDWVGRLGQMDVMDQQAVVESRQAFARFAGLLIDHAAHEDRWVHPRLKECDPGLADALEQEHRQIETDFQQVEGLFDQLMEPGDSDRWAILQSLYRQYAGFCSVYLAHMAKEESLSMTALQAHYTDADLLDLTNSIRGSLPPEKMGAFLSLMIPAMHVEERVAMFSNMKANAPQEAYEGTCHLARQVLSQADWAAVQNRIQ